MAKINLTIFVEGSTDQAVVRALVDSARFRNWAEIDIRPLGGKRRIASYIRHLTNTQTKKYAALIDADRISLADSRELARKQLGYPAIDVFCAVPTIEAWIFADPDFAKQAARSPHASDMIDRAPLPEAIPYPKQFAMNVFGSSDFYPSGNIDIDLAALRSPSLRSFLEGISGLIGADFYFHLPISTLSDTRDIVSTLLRELPDGKVVWRTIDGAQFTAGDIAKSIEEGLPAGNQYATELLRVARDLISRQAKK